MLPLVDFYKFVVWIKKINSIIEFWIKDKQKMKNHLALILMVISTKYGYSLLKSCQSIDFVVIMPEYCMFWKLFSLILKLIFYVLFESSLTHFCIPHKVYFVFLFSTLFQPYELQNQLFFQSWIYFFSNLSYNYYFFSILYLNPSY